MTVSLIILLFGYAYPAYHCYKTVKRTKVNNTEEKSDYKDLTSWCQYWILIAMFTVVVTVLDTFIFWFPIYSEVKLVIFICLFCSLPKTTEVVATNWYENLVHPFFEEHEDKIDSKLKDLKTISFWRNAYSNAWDLLKKGRQTLQPHQKNAEKHVAAPTSVSPVPHILSVPTNSITYVAESTDVSETISAGSVGNPTFFVDEDGPSCHCLPAEQRAAETIAAATSTPVGSRSVSVEESSSGSIHPDSG